MSLCDIVMCFHFLYTVNNTNFYPFGVDVGDAQMQMAVDGSSPPIYLSTPFRFFETPESILYVSQLCMFFLLICRLNDDDINCCFIPSWFLYVGLHKWDSFIPISIYFIYPSNVSIHRLPTDCSILGWCGHHTVWQHFLQTDVWFYPSSKSLWSTTWVIFILCQLYSKHTVHCHMG